MKQTNKPSWTKPFHDVSHLGELRDYRRATIVQYGDSADLYLYSKNPPDFFSAPSIKHFRSIKAAKRAGADWVNGHNSKERELQKEVNKLRAILKPIYDFIMIPNYDRLGLDRNEEYARILIKQQGAIKKIFKAPKHDAL